MSNVSPFHAFAAGAVLVLLLLSAACTQPASPRAVAEPVTPAPEPEPVTTPPVTGEPAKDVSATAKRPDDGTVVVTYHGGRDSDQLMELEVVVTDDRGTVRVRSMGSRLGTTPPQNGGSTTFTGPFTQKTHVVATGYFTDGSRAVVLDTWT